MIQIGLEPLGWPLDYTFSSWGNVELKSNKIKKAAASGGMKSVLRFFAPPYAYISIIL